MCPERSSPEPSPDAPAGDWTGTVSPGGKETGTETVDGAAGGRGAGTGDSAFVCTTPERGTWMGVPLTAGEEGATALAAGTEVPGAAAEGGAPGALGGGTGLTFTVAVTRTVGGLAELAAGGGAVGGTAGALGAAGTAMALGFGTAVAFTVVAG